MTNAVKDYFDSSMSHHQVANAVSLVTNYISTNVLIFASCHQEVLVVCKIFLQQISPQWFIYVFNLLARRHYVLESLEVMLSPSRWRPRPHEQNV